MKKAVPPLIALLLLLLLAASCSRGRADTPKPRAYLRIQMPRPDYILCDTAALPFTFQRSTFARLEWKKNTRGEKWVDLVYPRFRGVVFLTYKPLRGPADLAAQIDTSCRFLQEHYKLSSGVDESRYLDPDHNLYGATYHLKGQKVACTYQFWVSDSARHFLRGALYIDTPPNNDSLAPVLDYLQSDLDHLIETLRWKTTPQ